MDGDTTVEW
jgi:hypothetical protein